MSPAGWVAVATAAAAALIVATIAVRQGWQALQAWAQRSGESTLEPEEQRPGTDGQFERWLDEGDPSA